MLPIRPITKYSIISLLTSMITFTSGLTRFMCPGPGFWSDPTSCTAFYQCIPPLTVYRYLCPPGTRYDPRVHNCNHDFLAPPCHLSSDPGDETSESGFDLAPELKPEQTSETNDNDETSVSGQYLVSPTSLYPCSTPGYFSEETSCDNFYVCKEITPGVLSAERVFRCPDRYLFDPITQLCQRAHKVTCDTSLNPILLYKFRSSLVFQIKEDDLESFFSQDLTLRSSNKARNSFNNQHYFTPHLSYPFLIHYAPFH